MYVYRCVCAHIHEHTQIKIKWYFTCLHFMYYYIMLKTKKILKTENYLKNALFKVKYTESRPIY